MKIWYPNRPESLEDAKLGSFFIRDSILKTLYIRGISRGIEFSEVLKLPFSLVEHEIRHLRENHLIGPVGGAGVGGSNGIDFGLTKEGRAQAYEIFQRERYLGPAPVEMNDYRISVEHQRLQTRGIRRKHLEWAFKGIVIPPEYCDKIGPALGSGGPLFIYGKPGNGKTTVAERLSRLFRNPVYIPYSIQADGHIIQFFDEKVHRVVSLDQLPEDHPAQLDPRAIDERWVCVQRPFIIVGGELTLEMLDLIYHHGQSSYEAPFQMKANLGVLLVDDFGRQIVKPKDFLNRWIFPLEKGLDFLTLVNGKKVETPFDQMLIFSTNLHPSELADEAFWRRIKYKIEMPNPSELDFEKMFKRLCEKLSIIYDSKCYDYMITKYYKETGRELRSVHPRDLLNHMQDQISYNELDRTLSPQLIDLACQLYFGSVDPRINEAWKA